MTIFTVDYKNDRTAFIWTAPNRAIWIKKVKATFFCSWQSFETLPKPEWLKFIDGYCDEMHLTDGRMNDPEGKIEADDNIVFVTMARIGDRALEVKFHSNYGFAQLEEDGYWESMLRYQRNTMGLIVLSSEMAVHEECKSPGNMLTQHVKQRLKKMIQLFAEGKEQYPV